MPVQIRLDTALELHLKKVAAKGTKFPRRGGKYFEHYVSMKQRLADKYYSNTGAALSAEAGDRFTKHDISHIDDVIDAAGQMLGFGSDSSEAAYKKLEPFEVFVLLVAILLHDAGNATRREGHEKMTAEVLREVGGNASMSDLEQRIISTIAQAHGGELKDGNRDTIPGLLQEQEYYIGDLKVHAWRLAALVRLADELSENNTRADESAITNKDTPHRSLLANYYCLLISRRIDFISHSVQLNFELDVKYLPMKFRLKNNDGSTTEKMLIDYIADRLEKSEQERRYCNRFLAGFAPYDRIRVKLSIVRNNTVIDTVGFDLEEVGYPTLTKKVKEWAPRFDGRVLHDQHCGHVNEEQVS
jgi:hypothetical protein